MYEKFESLLLERNLTTYRVAKDTEIRQSVFSNWKHGRCKPKIEKLQILADYFDVPVTYFLDSNKNAVQ